MRHGSASASLPLPQALWHPRNGAWVLVIAVFLLLAASNGRLPATHGLNASGMVAARSPGQSTLRRGYLSGVAAPVRVASQRQYWQVGLLAGPEATGADAMRTAIMTRVPQRVPDRTTDYFWIGSYLADGSFIQVGYYIASSDQGHAGWFYCAYTAAGDQGPCVYGPAGSAGTNGQTHTYALEAISAAGHESMRWVARIDGAAVGQFNWTSASTGLHSPSIYAESSGFVPHPPDAQLGPVDFPGGIQTRTADQSGYATATHLQPVYAGPDVCPPYGITADGIGGAFLGSGLPCPSGASWL